MLVWKTQKAVNNNNNTKHDWVGKVIRWDMCKKFKFDHSNKCFMHNPEFLVENVTHKLHCDFKIQNGPLNLVQTS